MGSHNLAELKELASGKKLAKTEIEKQFVAGYSAAQQNIPFYQVVLGLKSSLEDLSKDEVLYLITGYSMGEMERNQLVDLNNASKTLEH